MNQGCGASNGPEAEFDGLVLLSRWPRPSFLDTSDRRLLPSSPTPCFSASTSPPSSLPLANSVSLWRPRETCCQCPPNLDGTTASIIAVYWIHRPRHGLEPQRVLSRTAQGIPRSPLVPTTVAATSALGDRDASGRFSVCVNQMEPNRIMVIQGGRFRSGSIAVIDVSGPLLEMAIC